MGYDTIYSLQDVEDDAIAGVKSSARRLGGKARVGIVGFYALCLAGLGLALWLRLPDPLVFVGLVPAAMHFLWQAATLDPADGHNALRRFRSNRFEIGRAHVCTPVTNAHLVCRLLLEKKKNKTKPQTHHTEHKCKNNINHT